MTINMAAPVISGTYVLFDAVEYFDYNTLRKID